MVRVQVISTTKSFEDAVTKISTGSGPIAIDAERASGFTYSQRAFLIQVHRKGAGIFLFDAPAIGDFSPLFSPLSSEMWILHAASQDLACLREVGINPRSIFDTELSARLVGLERVGLGAVVQELLGIHLEKEHSAADWSTRPLPESWLTYAALDVEHLIDVKDSLTELLIEQGKLDWAREEFDAILSKPEKPQAAEPWRRLSGLHTLKNPQHLAIARSLWMARDKLAQERDVASGRLIPDSSIIALARTSLKSKSELASFKEFSGRASRSSLDLWWDAYVLGTQDTNLPALRVASESIPAPRLWQEKRPEAYERLQLAKAAISEHAESLSMPLENLLTPSILREICWLPPSTVSVVTISEELAKLGARNWQILQTCSLISNAFVEASQKIAPEEASNSLETNM